CALPISHITVLDVATIATPAVVEACLGDRGHGLRVAGEAVQVRSVVVPRDGMLRDLFGEETVPLSVSVPGDDAEPLICPGRDLMVTRGTAVSLLGPPAVLAEVLRSSGAAQQHRPPRPAPGARLRGSGEGDTTVTVEAAVRRWVHAVVQATDTRLRRALLALLVLALVSVAVLLIGYQEPDGTRMTLLDAMYFTVETVGTIGYGDFSFREQPDWLRAYAIVLMLIGAVLAALVYALLTNMLVSRRLQESLGHGAVTGLRGHVVVVGLGSVGVGVAEAVVAADVPVVVVERHEANRYLTQARAMNARVVSGDATVARTLELVNLTKARAVAVLTSDDLTNLEVALAVRDQLGPRWPEVPVAIRLFDRNLATTVRQAFGLTHVRSTDELAAPWFVGAALGLDVLGTFYAGDVPLLYSRVVVTPGGGLDGLRLDTLTGRSRVLAVRPRGEGAVQRQVRRTTVLTADDEAFVVGPHEELLGLLRRDASPAPPPPTSADDGDRTRLGP
ncbi:MAG: potassium channel protein, partial [Cellulomonadaceae bacterium]|nr:potassium channel protein [Cellulomonadaceae bacterium]